MNKIISPHFIKLFLLLLLFVSMSCAMFSSKVFAQTKEDKDVVIPKADVSFIFHLSDRVVDGWLVFLDGLGKTFDPIIRPVFKPITSFLERTYQPWAKICALGLFIGAMIWVWVGMPKEYVNLGRKKKTVWTDLRFWTIISMLPHVIVYLYF